MFSDYQSGHEQNDALDSYKPSQLYFGSFRTEDKQTRKETQPTVGKLFWCNSVGGYLRFWWHYCLQIAITSLNCQSYSIKTLKLRWCLVAIFLGHWKQFYRFTVFIIFWTKWRKIRWNLLENSRYRSKKKLPPLNGLVAQLWLTIWALTSEYVIRFWH